MIIIDDKSKCCGCTACYSICPTKCIEMEIDEEGFKYPVVNPDNCLNCGACEKVCPVINTPSRDANNPVEAWVARNKDKEILNASSSGGFYSVIADKFLDENGYICGAAYTEDFEVKHLIFDSKDKIEVFRGSKYVQSDIIGVFGKIKTLLDNGNRVCFSGTACQVAGLKNYLKKDYQHLFLIDLVCHGVPSPSLWKEYKKNISEKYQSKICKINFRAKTLGYQTPVMQISFENGKTYEATGRVDIMLKAFFSHMSLRPSCFDCPCKGIERCSDITLFDCWNSKELIGIDDNLGQTAVLVQTDKGRKFIETLDEDCLLEKVALEQIIPSNGGGMIVKSAKYTPKRKEFYLNIKIYGLQQCARMILGITLKDKIMERMKWMFAYIGIQKNISRFRRLLQRRVRKSY